MAWPKVLFVDPEAVAYEPLRPGLAERGYEMHATASVPSALNLTGAHAYQTVFVALPLILQTGFISDLRAEHPELPVVIVLASEEMDCLTPQVLQAAIHIMAKPLTLDTVCLMLDRTLELVTLRRQVRQHRQVWCSQSAASRLSADRHLSPDSLETALVSKLRHIVPNLEVLGRGALHRAVLSYVEQLLLKIVLEECRGNQVRSAEILGINRNTLRKKMREFGLSLPRRGT